MPIEAMPLYVNVERIYNELRELRHDAQDALQPQELFPFDQLHYHGTDAVQFAANTLNLGPESRVIEIGSGFGGPARYLAQSAGCHVIALELQDHMHNLAASLTSRCGLDKRVSHVLGNALTYPLPQAALDGVVSWLAVHHIPERRQLLKRFAKALRPGGQIYIEDLYERAPFAESDRPDVAQTLFGVTLTSTADFIRDLTAAGFTNVSLTDMTADWTAFCAGRAAAWRSARDRHIRVHGEETYSRLAKFFSTVHHLFQTGSLGGLRVTGKI
jgi:cyclopropane fatty-acyl-phospholipid synthase-like methyltransferase